MEMITTVQKQTNGATKDLVTQLRSEASRNPVFSAVCHLFAMRERARQQVTIPALTANMKKAGFDYSRKEYENVLKFMGGIGLGHVDKDPKGRVRALRGVKLTLQSIGMAAVSGSDKLKKVSTQNRFTKLPGVRETIVEKAPSVTPLPPSVNKNSSMCEITFTVVVDGKKVNFNLEEQVPKAELAQFIASLYPRRPRGN